MRTLSQAVAAKLRLVAKYGRTGPALRRGLAMLARGEFAGFWRKLFRSLDGPDFEDGDSYDETAAYDAWKAAHALTDVDRDQLRREAAALADPPLFSVLLLAAGAGPELAPLCRIRSAADVSVVGIVRRPRRGCPCLPASR